MIKPKVSVIVNFHNGEKYLDQCLKSIIDQDFRDLEIILWDNNSNDGSSKIIEKYEDERVRYFFNKEKVSLYKARNQAINNARGELISFLDCDDWWEKNYLSSREKFFLNKNFHYFYCNANCFYQSQNKLKVYKNYTLPSGYIFDFLCKDYFLMISGVIFRKNLFSKYGFFNESYNIIGDYDFLMKISQFCKAHSCNSPLLNYRVHDQNFSKLNSKMFYNEYANWFYTNITQSKNKNYLNNTKLFELRLSYLEISYLIFNEKKNYDVLKKIASHKSFKEKIKLLILFFVPKKFLKYLKK
jgi:glycosyltransferase involved in cell wall biosynthesis